MDFPETMAQVRDAARELYRAALRPNALESWACTISNLIGANNAGFTILAPSGLAVIAGSVGSDEREGREYLDHFQHINPLRKFWQTAPQGEIFCIDSTLIDDEVRRTEFYSRYREHLDQGSGLGMMLDIRTTRVLVHASQPRKPGYESRARQLLSQLREDLLISFEIAGTLQLARYNTENIIRSLDEKGIGIAVLAEDGRVDHANQCMTEILTAGAVLSLSQGRLLSGSSVKIPDLQRLVQRTRKSGVGGRLSYQDEAGNQRGSIVTYPAPMAFDWEGPFENQVVLLVTDSARPKFFLSEVLRSTYHLTHAEARIAGMLCDGKTSRNMADELGVQINSVRAHLKAIFAKTGTHSQVELLKRLQIDGECM